MAQVGREAEAVWLVNVIGQLGDFSALGVDAVDGFLEFERAFVALLVGQAAVAGVGEPNRVVAAMDDSIVRRVEWFVIKKP